MSTLGYHLRTHLVDNRVIALTPAHRRILARVVLEQGRRDRLFVFDCPDSHLHVAAGCDRAAAGRLTHRITSSLTQRLGIPVGFVQYSPRPIEDQRHLDYTARYILRQRQHHGLPIDPRAEASSAADLLGLRTLGRYTVENVRQYLPRLSQADVLALSGLGSLRSVDTCADACQLEEAMRAAGCLNQLSGATREIIALRAAAVAAVGNRVATPTLATWLKVNRRTVQRLRNRHSDPALVRAIRLQLGCDGVASSGAEYA